MVISLIVPVAFLALAILIFAGAKLESKGGGEQMIKNVFIYLVLFATLMMTIGGGIAIFMAIADIIAPPAYHQPFEEFRNYPEKFIGPEGATQGTKLSDEELKERYDLMVATEKERQSSRAKNSLIKSFGWIIIPFPIFLYFKRNLARHEA